MKAPASNPDRILLDECRDVIIQGLKDRLNEQQLASENELAIRAAAYLLSLLSAEVKP